MARAPWRANELVIVTHGTVKLTWSDHVPGNVTLQQTARHRLSLDADGRLIVEQVIIADPVQFPTKATADPPATGEASTRITPCTMQAPGPLAGRAGDSASPNLDDEAQQPT